MVIVCGCCQMKKKKEGKEINKRKNIVNKIRSTVFSPFGRATDQIAK